MKVSKLCLKSAVVAGLFALFATVAVAQDKVLNPVEQAAIAAQTQLAIAEGAVANDRTGAIASIVNKWDGALPNAAALDQLKTALNAASNLTLAKVEAATSFAQVSQILLGSTPAVSAGGVGIESIGDLTQDLVYTPVTPCRIIDTRNYGSKPTAGSYRYFYVYGSNMSSQGGNSAGCSSPGGAPAAAAINFTATAPAASGWLTVFPYGYSAPSASFLNFAAGQTIANAGIFSTYYDIAGYPAIWVYNSQSTHYIADVMGYFYPISTSDSAFFQQVKAATWIDGNIGTLLTDSSWHFLGATTTNTVAAGDYVQITGNAAVGLSTAATADSQLDILPCYLLSGSTSAPSLIGGSIYAMVSPGKRQVMGISGVASGLAAGTYNFGMCYYNVGANPNWTNNDFNYVTTMVVHPQ